MKRATTRALVAPAGVAARLSAAAFTKTYPLAPSVLGAGSAIGLQVGGTTDADVVLALAGNTPFPTRPNGVIDLAHFSLTGESGSPVTLNAGGRTFDAVL